jgi:hypothetical protein
MRPVYDEHVYAGREATVEERCNPIGEITLIKEVADRDEIHQRRRTALPAETCHAGVHSFRHDE